MAFRLGALLPRRFRRDVTVIPTVRLSGAIGGASRLQTGLSLAGVEPALKKAFAMNAPAVAIVINSPGGAPVQSHLIYRRIRQLAAEKDKKVIVSVEDVAASGGYLIALAGDEIIADASSLVGSIGVVSASFGFPKLLERIGVERRVHTVGENKAILDPFKPEREEDVARLVEIQNDMYENFVDLVKERRGEALADHPDLFTGAFWTGGRAHELGLVDQTGDLRSILVERYGKGVETKVIATERNRFLKRLGLGGQAGQAAAGLVEALEERAMWSRFGL